jgi:predicted esterase
MINRWNIIEPIGKRKGCIIGLPGRGMEGAMMAKFCSHMELKNSMIVTLEPDGYEWYPAPNGANDQDQAVKGLGVAVNEINKRISKIQRAFHLRRQQIALIGYSAGAVMTLQLLAASKQPFAAVVCFAGAILEPGKMPAATNQTPVLLRHAYDDECFSWEERFMPMRDALLEKDYNLYVSEKSWGGHGINFDDVRTIGRFVGNNLGYEQIEDGD